MEDTLYWSWNRISDDGQSRLSSISVYENKIYERWEKIKKPKAGSSMKKRRRGSSMPRGWLKHAKKLLICAQHAKNAKSKTAKEQPEGKVTKST